MRARAAAEASREILEMEKNGAGRTGGEKGNGPPRSTAQMRKFFAPRKSQRF
jgi:hypothetical protein